MIDNNLHGIHMDPCYKNFTRILSNAKTASVTLKRSMRRSQGPSSLEAAWLFPEECYICKKVRVQYKGKKLLPVKIAATDAVDSVKAAARAKNMEMYLEIKDLCLFAKEFKTHVHCYKDFTRGYTKKDRETTLDEQMVSFVNLYYR